MSAFEGWGIVELLGHRIRYGRVSEVVVFGEPFCRIDMPTDPPTFELYAGKSIYGLRPASEATIRAYHAPRRALTAGAPDDPSDWPDDDTDEPQCSFCAEPLGTEPTERVETGPEGEVEIWHEHCAAEHAASAAGDPDPAPINAQPERAP